MSKDTLAILLAAPALVAAVVTAVLARRSAHEANATSSWAALTAAHQAEFRRLSDRITAVEEALERERRARASLAEVVRSAWGYIVQLRDQIRALGGHPDELPPELTAYARQDGLVVDRVKTTISRTVVTDTRDPDGGDPPLQHVDVEMHPLDEDADLD